MDCAAGCGAWQPAVVLLSCADAHIRILAADTEHSGGGVLPRKAARGRFHAVPAVLGGNDAAAVHNRQRKDALAAGEHSAAADSSRGQILGRCGVGDRLARRYIAGCYRAERGDLFGRARLVVRAVQAGAAWNGRRGGAAASRRAVRLCGGRAARARRTGGAAVWRGASRQVRGDTGGVDPVRAHDPRGRNGGVSQRGCAGGDAGLYADIARYYATDARIRAVGRR